ncbi:uncharacterized protein [Sylvia atricapilla]|uniref:uncharacterized protein n=1 Tax=Sylvia atricapilla TaxID=48155 RepID=UPI003395279D
MAISSSPAGRCGILDSKHWRGRFSTCNLANFLLLLAPKGGRFVSCAAKATAVKVAGAPVSQNLKGYVCLLAIQIVRFRDRSIQTTSSQYYVKNGSLQVKAVLKGILLEKSVKTQRIFLGEKKVVMCKDTASSLSAKKMYILLLEIELRTAKYPMADYRRLREPRNEAARPGRWEKPGAPQPNPAQLEEVCPERPLEEERHVTEGCQCYSPRVSRPCQFAK